MRSEEYMNEAAQERHDKALAEILNISYDELTDSTYEISEDTGNDDVVHGYILTFDTEQTSADILSKVARLEGGDTVLLPLNYHEEPDDEL